MKTLTRIGYTYTELTDTAKEAVKQWYLGDPFRAEQLSELFDFSFMRYFFPNSKLDVQWSLSSCQGDGVNIYGKLDLADVLQYILNWDKREHSKGERPDGEFTSKEVKRLMWYADYVGKTELSQNRHYCYCTARLNDIASDMIDYLVTDGIRDIDKPLIFKFDKAVISAITRLCAEMEKYGYDYLYECEEEEIAETCAANEWYFDANGKYITGWR